MNKNFLNKLSAVLLAAAMVVTGVLMPSTNANASEYIVNDYFDSKYPGAGYWITEKPNECYVSLHISSEADPTHNITAQSIDYNPYYCTKDGYITLPKGYSGDITWTYTPINNHQMNFDEMIWVIDLRTGNTKSKTFVEIPMYGYTHTSGNSYCFSIHLDNYDGSQYIMTGNSMIDNKWRGWISAKVFCTTGDINAPLTSAAPARTAADEAAYQAAGGDAAYASNASANNSSTNTSSTSETFSMYRFRHPTTGEHLYTASAAEAANVKKSGWIDETPAGGAWKAPTKSTAPVYRLYNPNKKTCNHLYSMNQTEMTNLTKAGWKVEGVAYYSDTNKCVPVYREYNKKTGDHNYTTNLAEHNQLAVQGWTAEGVAWYGVK